MLFRRRQDVVCKRDAGVWVAMGGCGEQFEVKRGGGMGRVGVVSFHPERGLGVPVAQRWGPEPLPHMSHNPR